MSEAVRPARRVLPVCVQVMAVEFCTQTERVVRPYSMPVRMPLMAVQAYWQTDKGPGHSRCTEPSGFCACMAAKPPQRACQFGL